MLKKLIIFPRGKRFFFVNVKVKDHLDIARHEQVKELLPPLPNGGSVFWDKSLLGHKTKDCPPPLRN